MKEKSNIGRMPTEQELLYIKEKFAYDSESGEISRTDRKNSGGCIDHYGYKIIKIKGRQYKAHRIAWYLHYNVFPLEEIDHINQIKIDNRIENLRISTRQQQNLNIGRKCKNETGELGIYLDHTSGLKKKYATQSMGKTYRFYTLAEAKEFRNNLKSKVL